MTGVADKIHVSSNSAFIPYNRLSDQEKKNMRPAAKVDTSLKDYQALMYVKAGLLTIKKDFNTACQIFQNNVSYINADPHLMALVHTVLGTELASQKRYEDSVPHYKIAVKAIRLMNKSLIEKSAHQLSLLASQKRYEDSVKHYKCAVNANRLMNKSFTEKCADQLSLTRDLFANVTSLELYRQLFKQERDKSEQACLLIKIGAVLYKLGSYPEGSKCYLKAVALMQEASKESMGGS